MINAIMNNAAKYVVNVDLALGHDGKDLLYVHYKDKRIHNIFNYSYFCLS